MSWKIDPSHSEIGFSVKHMMISTVRGQFTTFDGTLTLNEEHPEQSVIEGWVETASVNTHEPNRDGHLRSPDFFDVEKFPKITFRSKKVTHTGGEKFKLLGDLTVKDTHARSRSMLPTKARTRIRGVTRGVPSSPTPASTVRISG